MHKYRNNHTISTKCQYQDLVSNPMWCFVVKWFRFSRIKQISKNVVPINTCSPWKPVATKKVEPYMESAIVKGDSIYSKAWRVVKKIPRRIVIPNLIILSFLFPRDYWVVRSCYSDSKILIVLRCLKVG